MPRKALLLALLLAGILQFTALTSHASAVNPADWKAGAIIDDVVFTKKDSMSVSQIQTFLNNLVTCDTNGTKTSELGGGTRAQYGAAHSNPAPFTCLKDYYEVPKTTPGPGMPANNYGGVAIPAGALSAAQLIWNAAQEFNISPQVLLVKIATESAGPLTSDEWPFLRQYTYAMGAHCPDSGPNGSANCDPNYAGFSMQIREAASLMRWYLDSMSQSWWPYKKPYQVNSILWNVQPSGCGAGDVYIQSNATAALYTYTPYQPNQAAINNMYGTGDSCSAYGNRNFWRVFNDWFGPSISTSPFFSYGGRVFMKGAGNTYYDVPSQAILDAYGIFTSFKGIINYVDPSYVSNMVTKGSLPWITRFDNNDVFVVTKNGLHRFTSEADFLNFGYTFGQEAVLPSWLQSSYAASTNMQPLVTQTDWKKIHYITNGVKQEIANSLAFTTMGTPIYSTRPNVTLPPEYLSTLPDGAPILPTGQFIKNTDNGQTYIYTNNLLTPLSSGISTLWSAPIDYEAPTHLLDLLAKGTQTITSQLVTSSSDGTQYLIDNNRKFTLTTDQKNQYGINSQTYQALNQDILARFPTVKLTDLVRQFNSPQVYLAKSGQLYHVYSELDVAHLGYAQNDVTVLTVPLNTLFTYSNINMYANSRLIRVSGSLEVFIIDNNFIKYHIPDESTFYQYGYKFNSVSVVNPGELTGYTGSDPLSQRVKDSSGNYWVIGSACRWQLPSTLLATFGSSTQFQVVGQEIISSVNTCGVMTNLIRANNSPMVYLLDNGQRHWIPSEQLFYQKQYSQSQVRVLSPEVVQAIPQGSNVQ